MPNIPQLVKPPARTWTLVVVVLKVLPLLLKVVTLILLLLLLLNISPPLPYYIYIYIITTNNEWKQHPVYDCKFLSLFFFLSIMGAAEGFVLVFALVLLFDGAISYQRPPARSDLYVPLSPDLGPTSPQQVHHIYSLFFRYIFCSPINLSFKSSLSFGVIIIRFMVSKHVSYCLQFNRPLRIGYLLLE